MVGYIVGGNNGTTKPFLEFGESETHRDTMMGPNRSENCGGGDGIPGAYGLYKRIAVTLPGGNIKSN